MKVLYAIDYRADSWRNVPEIPLRMGEGKEKAQILKYLLLPTGFKEQKAIFKIPDFLDISKEHRFVL
jgi:hypothetical protein